MRKTIIILLTLVFALTACAPSADEPISSDTSYPNASYPNASYPNPSSQDDYAPQSTDASMTRGNAFLNSKELISLESFPLQFMLHLSGNLPTPCHQLRVAISQPDSENKVLVDVYSISEPDTICTQVLAPFDANIPLGSFPTGLYTLWVNGEMVAQFQS